MRYLFFVLLAVFGIHRTAYTHPHAFIDLKTHALIDNGFLQGFDTRWILDDLASAELIYEIQSSADPEQARQNIAEELSETARAAHFFSTLHDKHNRTLAFADRPSRYEVEVKDGRIHFLMTITLQNAFDVTQSPVVLRTYEPSYYISMEYGEPNDVSVSDNHCKAHWEQPKTDNSLRQYAQSLDKNDTPDLPDNEALSLGAHFAQKMVIQCPI